MSYGDVIKDAFWIAWRNRFMWFFGFFVSGAAGSFVSPTNFATFGGQQTDGVAYGFQYPGPLRWISENLVLFAIIAVVFVVLVVSIWLALYVISRGALA